MIFQRFHTFIHRPQRLWHFSEVRRPLSRRRASKDIVTMLFGGKVLYVLRPRGRTWGSGQTWKFLGEAYLHGQMDGTALSMKRA